jgi:Zn-dependent protease
MQGLFNFDIATFIARVVILVIAFTIHELAHALTADYFGDDTPRMNGRITLNPLKHLDPVGSLLLLVAGFGWAKPVPINPYVLGRRSPAAVMWVSLAGPVSNFLMALVAAIPLRFHLITYSARPVSFLPSAYEFLIDFILINLSLLLFNLIPIAPLDGEKIVEYFFPPRWNDFMDRIRPYGPLILMVLLFGAPLIGIDIVGLIMGPPLTALSRLLIGV